jgi:hypothetical protein
MSNEKKTVQVYLHAETTTAIGVFVSLILDSDGHIQSGSRVEWFPKSICSLEKKEISGKLPEYFLTAPEWILKSKKVKY